MRTGTETVDDGLQAELHRLGNLERRGWGFFLGAVGSNLAAFASLLLGPPGVVLFVALLVLGAFLMYTAFRAFCESKGQPGGWAVLAAVLCLLGTGLLALLLIAILPDRNKDLRESTAAGCQLYKPALYSIIIGVPMPYFGLPIAIYSLVQINGEPERWRGRLLAIGGIVVSTAMILLLGAMIISDSKR